MSIQEELREKIRSIPDFPKKGILFRDITTLIKEKESFSQVIETFAKRYSGKKVDAVASVESRGFILGGALAYRLGTGIVPIRKEGKLPWNTHRVTYDLEYGKDTLEIHSDALSRENRVVIVDDLLATGGTASAAAELVQKLGARILEFCFLIELEELQGRKKLSGYPVFSIIKF